MTINSWEFDPNDYNPNGGVFELVPVGHHRVRIEEAKETVSKTGKDMVVLTLCVSKHKGKLWFNLVFDLNNKAMTNQKLGEIWESFDLKVGDMNLLSWKGKVGACNVKHKLKEGTSEMQAQVSYFLSRKKQEDLPAWAEPDGSAPAYDSTIPTGTVDGDGNVNLPY